MKNSMVNNHKAKYPIQTLEKALEVVEVLFKKGVSMGISDIDSSTGIGKSTIHRVLDTLMSFGYVEKCDDNSKYRLSWKFFEIGQSIPFQRNLSNLNADVLHEVCNKYGESINMGIRSDNAVVVISRIVPKTNLAANVPVGSRLPLHASAMGKLMICEMNERELTEIFPEQKLEQYTPNTVQTFSELLSQLETIRKQGYSIDDQEVYIDITCIAMPIKNYKNETVATVSVSGPSSRLNLTKIFSIKDDLAFACKEMSKYLGQPE